MEQTDTTKLLRGKKKPHPIILEVVQVDNPKQKFPELSTSSCEKCDAIDNVLNRNHMFVQNISYLHMEAIFL